MKRYVDTHCHLDSILKRKKKDRYQDLAPEFSEFCDGVIHISCDPDSLQRGKEFLAESKVWGAFGIHPHDARLYSDLIETEILGMLEHQKAVAWGEIGLDYHYDLSPVAIQQEVFQRQLHHAVQKTLPIVIHTREAEDDTLAILQECVPADHPMHIHCYTSGPEFAGTILNQWNRAYFGFTGVVTFPKSDAIRKAVQTIPLDRILLETDGPFMAPVPHRGTISHPGLIPSIAECLASVKALPLEDLYFAARQNTTDLYGI